MLMISSISEMNLQKKGCVILKMVASGSVLQKLFLPLNTFSYFSYFSSRGMNSLVGLSGRFFQFLNLDLLIGIRDHAVDHAYKIGLWNRFFPTRWQRDWLVLFIGFEYLSFHRSAILKF